MLRKYALVTCVSARENACSQPAHEVEFFRQASQRPNRTTVTQRVVGGGVVQRACNHVKRQAACAAAVAQKMAVLHVTRECGRHVAVAAAFAQQAIPTPL